MVARDLKSLVGEVPSDSLHPARRADAGWMSEARSPFGAKRVARRRKHGVVYVQIISVFQWIACRDGAIVECHVVSPKRDSRDDRIAAAATKLCSKIAL